MKFIGILGTLSFLALAACVLLNMTAALVFILRKNAHKRADWFFAGLLLALAGTSLHHVFILQNFYKSEPQLLYLPIYMTLSFGALLFFAVKLWLFPNYRFVPSDCKHLILPGGQWLYFLSIFLLTDVAFRQTLGRKFYSPFYGGLEMGLYITTFSAYLLAAYRYIRFKIAAVRHDTAGHFLHEMYVLRRMIRVLLILFWVNSAYIVIDFVMYELLRLNMHDLRGFTRIGDLSFAALSGWVGLTGWLLLSRQPYLNVSGVVFSFLKRMLRGAKSYCL